MSNSNRCDDCENCIRCRSLLGRSYAPGGPCDWAPSRFVASPAALLGSAIAERDAERARADAAERLCVELAPFVSAWRKTPTPLPAGWREQVEAMRERQRR